VPSAPIFPESRASRGVPSSFAPAASVAVGGAPTTRTVAFRVANPAANSRQTVSCGPFLGPAILKRAQWWCDNANASAQHALELGYSPTQVTEAAVTFATPKPWTPLIEIATSDVYANIVNATGFWQPNTTGPLVGFRGDLNIIINVPKFFITITAHGSAGAGNRWTGDMTVIQGVSEAALANFL
jgi:hypothetical protein